TRAMLACAAARLRAFAHAAHYAPQLTITPCIAYSLGDRSGVLGLRHHIYDSQPKPTSLTTTDQVSTRFSWDIMGQASSPSIASSGFAQVLGDDVRYMYTAGLSDITASASAVQLLQHMNHEPQTRNLPLGTGSASSNLSQWQRLNAGLSGPLAFEQDFSALEDPAYSQDAAYASESCDFHHDGTPPAPPIDMQQLLNRFRSLDLRVRVLEAERSGAQQALWHHHRAAYDSQRLRSLISPWAFMSSKVDAISASLQRALSRLSGLSITLQQSFPAIAQFFTEQALGGPPLNQLAASPSACTSQSGLIYADDDLSAQHSASASQQPTAEAAHAEPTSPDQEPWLLPKPDTCLYNIFGESFELQALKEKIAKGQMPHCLYRDPEAIDHQPLNRQEMWSAMQYKPIYRTGQMDLLGPLEPKASTSPAEPAGSAAANTLGNKPEPPPQQHLRPPESQTFLPKEGDAQPKPLPTKPPPTNQPTQDQPAPTDRPGSSKDASQDLSAADPARVYAPQPGQHLDIDSFRVLDQPGAATKPYIFDIGLLDRRAQPLFSHPNYKPIECMIFERRPWICFYGGSTPTEVAEVDDYWYTMYTADGSCCLPDWPAFPLENFMRLFADPPPSPEPTLQADDDFARERFPLPANYRPSFGRFWHVGCAGTRNPRSTDPPTRPPTVQIARSMQPEDLTHGRKGVTIPFPEKPWLPLPTCNGAARVLQRRIMNPHSLEQADDHKGPPTRRTSPVEISEQSHQSVQPAALASAMSDLNSPEKPRSEPSLSDRHPRSWSDVTLIEDITQDLSARHLSAHCLEDYLDSSPESVAEQTSPTETDTALVGELHQEAQDAMGIVTRASQEHTRKEACLAEWQEILRTLERYIGAAKHFLDFLGLSNRSVDCVDVPFLADFLHACENSLEEDLRLFLGGLLLALHGGLRVGVHLGPSPGEVSSFGEGVSRFVYSREADLEASAFQQVPEVSQEPQPDHRPELTTSRIPADDTEALLVERFANQRHSSSDSEDEPKDHGVHEILYQALALKGLESVDDFAYAFPEIKSLEDLLSGLSDSDLSDMGSTDQFHGVQAARIRKALRFAHDLCQQPAEPTPQSSQPPSLPAAIMLQASPASWVENLPPKLSQEATQELIDDFKTNYPGELLDEDTMPSIRLLSLVQHSLKPGEKIRWIPWQFRLSSKQYTEIMEAKSSKPMRTEAQLLASALYDDTPEMPVAHLRLSASWLSRIQTVYRNAWALCGAAAADRKIWGTIGALVSAGWSMDEALYEVTSIRSDLSNLLQPRPRNALPSTPHKGRERPNTPTPPPPKRTRTTPFTPPKYPKNLKGKGKGGKQGKGLGNRGLAFQLGVQSPRQGPMQAVPAEPMHSSQLQIRSPVCCPRLRQRTLRNTPRQQDLVTRAPSAPASA
ncbi:unnamed protein product, partial [Symbiodinium microadriaticum]